MTFVYPSQAFMEVVTSVISLLSSGISSNWWGFGCPLHCGSPLWGSLLAALLSGAILGFGVGFGAATSSAPTGAILDPAVQVLA